ncbi:uncharacterized protein BXZ73DRAFT_38266, partial [Epithele typhae]|uniref:uncharacterized protein n=1 Tax=Epithele typhae TaxID=378194 RepID=UPI0020076EFF
MVAGDDACITDDRIREILRVPPDTELSLNALPESEPGARPGQSLTALAQFAILGSEDRRLTLSEIYERLEERFEWFGRDKNKSWKRSLRHALSLHKVFEHVPRPLTDPGKGGYWTLNFNF